MAWEADREVLLRLYAGLVLSKIGHGCVLYSLDRRPCLKNLDPVHILGLWYATGAFALVLHKVYIVREE